MKGRPGRKRWLCMQLFLFVCALGTGIGLVVLTLRPMDPPVITVEFPRDTVPDDGSNDLIQGGGNGGARTCVTVEEMGQEFEQGVWEESLKIRRIIRDHFIENGASRVRDLPAEQFCHHGFVLGKTAEAGFGNEMYKILSAAALSIMLNRSLIIGQTRGKYPFGEYIAYSNVTFTMKEIKHLWRRNGCEKKYGRHLVMRIDDFEKPTESNVLCSNWLSWKQPIIWFQGTTDAVGAQFFLKNVHSEMRNAASSLFGDMEFLQNRPNVFGELMRVLIFPSKDVEEAVNWVVGGGNDPDISLHMRMLMNRSVRASQAAVKCISKVLQNLQEVRKPKVVLVSDTPSMIRSIKRNISDFAEVLHFDYDGFKGNMSRGGLNKLDFRVKDWGPAPRWVAFVDFFLASRAKYAVISGAHKRVGTTYAQLVAALAAAYNLGDNSTGSSFSFLSSFQSNLLTEGLKNQIGWGHVWNRYAGVLSCRHQRSQCAFTPILPPGWYDGLWQSPIERDIHRLASFGIELSGFGTVDKTALQNHCNSRKETVKTILFRL